MIILALLALGGCIPRPEMPRPQSGGTAERREPDKVLRQCEADLARAAIAFKPLPDRTFDGGCSAIGAVQLLDIGTPVTNLGAMTCPLASNFARWVKESVQPAARRWLGARVAKVESMGSYACRPLNGQAGNKLSEHGRANAVDIGAFVLEDGRRITILSGWNGTDEKIRGFLREAHGSGCRQFQIGLGPDANAYHRDHFHFDMGQGPYCR
ncbi:MAG TPA: extensin family protein [Allosphingosinicella sp.]